MTVAGTIALSIMAHLAYAQVFSRLAMGPRAAMYSGHFRVFLPFPVSNCYYIYPEWGLIERQIADFPSLLAAIWIGHSDGGTDFPMGAGNQRQAYITH